MALFLQSPGVQVIEKNASGSIPGASTTTGATVGDFSWGPVNQPMLIDSEDTLVKTFGAPTDSNFQHFFAARNFLAYSGAMFVVNVSNGGLNAKAGGAGTNQAQINNLFVYQNTTTLDSTVIARYPGAAGNGLIVSYADLNTFATWPYASQFQAPTANNQLHVIVIDGSGKFSGVAGTVLEKYSFLDKAGNAVSYQGTTNYYKAVIEARSQYIYVMSHPTGTTNWGGPVGTNFDTMVDSVGISGYDDTWTLAAGSDGAAVTDAQLQAGWDLLKNPEEFDISLLISGSASQVLGQYITSNIAETRRDCVNFLSICTSAGTPIYGTSTSRITDAKGYKTAVGNSTYHVIDSGYKYQYDRYNDKYRWVALNADTAGLCAKVDSTHDTWFSPAGYIKGQIKDAVKLAWNPTRAERDVIYPLGVNAIVSIVGEGTLLYGDKTGTSVPDAFDHINVRRLFLVLEKSISRAAKYRLFDQNDAITRALFVSQVEPFLRDVKGRRGIEAFQVICDETNNTPSVVASNEFRASILIKPVYSINAITLTFTAVGPDVSFAVAAGV